MHRLTHLAVALAILGAGCQKKSDGAPGNSVATDLPAAGATGGPVRRKVDAVAPPAGIDVTSPPKDAITTPDGVIFKSLADGTGASPGKNDTVTLVYTGWRASGETFYSTKSKGKPVEVKLYNVAVGFAEAITMMKKGGHAVFWVPPEVGYQGGSSAKERLAFEAELVDFKPAPPVPADVAAPPPDATRTTHGVAFVVEKPGTGKDKVRFFDNVSFKYTAWDAKGRMFDSTELRGATRTTTPFRETVALEDALTQMTLGEKARFWFPPEANKGSLNAPGGQLCYEIELVDVKPQHAPPPVPPDVAAPPKDAKKTASGVAYQVLEPGTGKDHPAPTDTVKVHYTGWTTDGRMFDSSVVKDLPAEFSLQGVIKGWTDGIPTMVVGETTRFWIPVELAYNNAPGKPAGMLVFDVKLIEIEHGPPPPPPGAGGGHPGIPPIGPAHPPMGGGMPPGHP